MQGDLGDLNIEWRKSDLVLRTAKANRVQDAFHYVIPSANRNDAGTYKCIVVSTIYGNMTVDSLMKILHVNFGPVVKIASSPSHVINHSTVAVDQHEDNYINCSAEGYPPPGVVLSHNDKQINDNDGSLLKIVSAMERDAGRYCCNASNALGRYNQTCLTLDVNFGPVVEISSQPIPVDRVVTVELHENIYVNCSARGHPTPVVVVLHNGKLANASNLEIISATETDAGTYCCNASNAAGRYNVTCLMLRVIFGPIVRIVSHPFRIKEGVVTVDQSEQNKINCSAEGYPPPEIFLFYNNNPGNGSFTLEISSAAEADEGEYCCNASNLLGRHNVTCLSLQVEKSSSGAPTLTAVATSISLFVLLIIALGACFYTYHRRKTARYRTSGEKPEPDGLEIGSSDWDTIKDLCMAIDPSFKRKYAYKAMEIKRRREGYSNDFYWAERCLETWINENPEQDLFLSAIYDKLNKMQKYELARKLRERFPNHFKNNQGTSNLASGQSTGNQFELDIWETDGEVKSQQSEISVNPRSANTVESEAVGTSASGTAASAAYRYNEQPASEKITTFDTDRVQEIYDEALKHGSVTVNRVRVIVAGQDRVGKSCLVDSLLNKPFEKNKARTEGAAVALIHTARSCWVATDSKDHFKSSYFVVESKVKQTSPVKTLEKDSKAVGMEAVTLTANQQKLVNAFLTDRPSEEDLNKQILGVRDIWDLGGQEVYLATHSALMPDRKAFGLSIYMIVMDISKSLSDKAESIRRSSRGEVIDETNELGWIRTNGDFPLYWFGLITAAHEETPMGDNWLGRDEGVVPPPVFVIGSHRDVLDNDKKKFADSASVKKWLTKQGELFELLLSNSDFMKHIVLPKKHKIGKASDDENFPDMAHFVKSIFLIDNSASGSGSPCKTVNEIRERVDHMTTAYWKGMKKVPLFWVYLEILLFRWREIMKTAVAKVDEIVTLAQHLTLCNVQTRDGVLVALKYLSNVGAILYYPDVDGLQDVVFTSPEWVIKALSAFVTAAKPGPLMKPKWTILKKKGVMSNDLIKYRLKQMRDAHSSDLEVTDQEQTENENRLILRLLELLDVITPVEGSPQMELYVPSMLKMSSLYTTTHWENLSNSEPSARRGLPAPLIVLPTQLKFVPECLFFRLITRFLKIYPSRPRLSRHQCIFVAQDEKSPVEVEIELMYHNRGKWIALTICFMSLDDVAKTSPSFLHSIREKLCKLMRNICQQGIQGFRFSICCQMKRAVNEDLDLESLPVLLNSNKNFEYSPRDAKLYNMFGQQLQVKPEEIFRINCWFGYQPIIIDNRLVYPDTPLPDAINHTFIRAVATQAEAKWEKLAIILGQTQTHSAVENYKEASKSAIVLENWVTARGNAATVSEVIRACEMCGIPQKAIEASYIKEALEIYDTAVTELPFQVKGYYTPGDSISVIIKGQKVTLVKKDSKCETIDRNGGKVELRDYGITLDIPAGALQQKSKIHIALFSAERLISLNDNKMADVNVIELRPHQKEFDIPAVIRRRLYHSQGMECGSSGSRMYFHYGEGLSQSELLDSMGLLDRNNRQIVYKKTKISLGTSFFELQSSSFCYYCITSKKEKFRVAVSLFTKMIEDEWELQVCCSCACKSAVESIEEDMLRKDYHLSETRWWQFTMGNHSNERIHFELHHDDATNHVSIDELTVTWDTFYDCVEDPSKFPQVNRVTTIKVPSDQEVITKVRIIGRHLRTETPNPFLALAGAKESEKELGHYKWTVTRPTKRDVNTSGKTAASSAGVSPARARITKRFPDDGEFNRLSKKLSKSWKYVARELGLDSYTISTIERNYPNDARECAFQMLDKWRSSKFETATVDTLCKALRSEGVMYNDIFQ